MTRKRESILPDIGERCAIIGQTGSGKTAFAAWMLLRVPMSPVIIYDTKEEAKFDAFPDVVFVATQEELDKAYADQSSDYIVCRPPIAVTSDPAALDDMLYHHYLHYRNSLAYLDEAYMFHSSAGRAGKGLLGLMTRGRSRGITTIMSSQRPAWISQFIMSEAQKFYIFYLQKQSDKVRIEEIVPDFSDLPDPPKFGFYFFRAGERMATRYGAVRLAAGQDTGYVDNQSGQEPDGSPDEAGTLPTVAPKRRGTIFI